jgi:hypothetical protein
MRLPRLPNQRPPRRREPTLQAQLEQPFLTADYALLCCFGVDSTGERSAEQLRLALLTAGFSGPLARHLVRVSPLLHPTSAGCFRLRGFER